MFLGISGINLPLLALLPLPPLPPLPPPRRRTPSARSHLHVEVAGGRYVRSVSAGADQNPDVLVLAGL